MKTYTVTEPLNPPDWVPPFTDSAWDEVIFGDVFFETDSGAMAFTAEPFGDWEAV